jgi:lysozyme
VNRQRLADTLKKHEGVKQLPYTDSEGHLTIGVGHLMSEPLPLTVVDALLQSDIDKAVRELDRQFFGWNAHNEPRREVLANMMFNLGAVRFAGFIKFWKALDRRAYDEAAREMLDSKWAKQVGKRAIELAEQMRTGQVPGEA